MEEARGTKQFGFAFELSDEALKICSTEDLVEALVKSFRDSMRFQIAEAKSRN